MATELTVKERAFARLVIEGTKTAAYRQVYSDRGSAATQAVNAYKFSKKPKIKREVARLLRQREPPADDYARIRDVAVAGLMEMFLQEPDPRLRVKVGSVLLAYADAGLKLHPISSEKERKYDELSAFLANVVREQKAAVGREQEPLLVETEKTEGSLCQVESSFEEPESEDSRPGAMTVSERLVEELSEDIEPKGKSELVPIPGCFPPRFRRVR